MRFKVSAAGRMKSTAAANPLSSFIPNFLLPICTKGNIPPKAANEMIPAPGVNLPVFPGTKLTRSLCKPFVSPTALLKCLVL